MTNLQMVNITALNFCVWQHLGKNHSDTKLQHLAMISSIPVHKVYQHLLNNTLQLTPFNMEPSEVRILYGACSPTQEYTFQLWDHSYQQELDYSVAISFGADLPD